MTMKTPDQWADEICRDILIDKADRSLLEEYIHAIQKEKPASRDHYCEHGILFVNRCDRCITMGIGAGNPRKA